MANVLGDARVRALLHALDDASRLQGDYRQQPEGLDDTVRDLQADLGKRVYHIYLEILTDPAPVTAEVTAELASGSDAFELGPDDDPTTDGPPGFGCHTDDATQDEPLRETWYTDEDSWEGNSDGIFSPDDGLEDRVPEDRELPAPSVPIATSDQEILTPAGDDGGWRAPAGHLLRLLQPSDDEADANSLAVEATRIQWATSEVDAQLGRLPRALRVGLVGMLAARARNLQQATDADAGPHIALERLRQYARAGGLPDVPGLRPNAPPETGSWEDDAHRWWQAISRAMERARPAEPEDVTRPE